MRRASAVIAAVLAVVWGTAVSYAAGSTEGWRWEKVPDVPFSECTGLAYAPTEPDTIYALGDGKLFVSADRGRTWRHLPQYGGDTISSPVVKPDNPSQLYSWDQTSLLWSADGGDTWNTVPLPAPSVHVMACTAGSPGYLFLGSRSGGFWRTDLQGANAQEIRDLGGPVESMAASCRNPSQLYAIVILGDVLSRKARLMRSSDAGLTWSQIGKDTLAGRPMQIALAASDDAIVDVLSEVKQFGPDGAAYYRSRDRGRTWSKPVAVGEFAGPTSIDVRDSNRVVTFADFMGARISTDGGRAWQAIANPQANLTEPMALAALGDGVVLGALGADRPELCRLVGKVGRTPGAR